MADVRRKRPTERRAVAVGELDPGADTFKVIVERGLPKGDALGMAEVAGLQGAKQASALMPLCHPLPLEYVEVHCQPVPERAVIRVYCEVATIARTGVEMETLAGVNAALLTLYDLTKPVQPALTLGGVRLLFKEGGKKGLWQHPDGMSETEIERFRPRAPAGLKQARCAVITLSDRAARGDYEDRSGALLVERLRALEAQVEAATVLPDDRGRLLEALRAETDADTALVLLSGGTGLGPRDITPEALAELDARRVPGLGELFRSESRHFTPMAWLSRAEAVLAGRTLIIALPGSAKAAAQGMDILAPILAHALSMAAGGDHA
ncbi:bifunctional molybdenum cofactor biosynthesis protein MoaC/MoaB [Oleiagrimonas sp. C23AA]|nr:bifunctional molybdenum cofactor biosynthesis protein MoaC/MoaB [Oleiagrimonas sp. C23AA]